ncbi:MAG TPA: DNA translocase FtsK 4TM domain-containing protein, partial [Beutenbergiaceae bacterium]|nr:DNA translocase FtsK 4TM domain-containing protein [Beutenbergiaceae bacterium]
MAARTTSSRRSASSTSPANSHQETQQILLVRMVKGAVRGVTSLVGGVFRSFGSGAQNLDPELRRDGLGFLILAAAIVIAVREWFGVSGAAGEVIHAAVAGAVGILAITLPVLLVYVAFRVMRHPDRSQVNGRITIGLAAIVAAVAGLIAVFSGLPSPSEWDGLFRAGGLLGYVMANPLSALISTWGSVPLLILLAFFGVLVVTATPVAAIPRRLGNAWAWLTGGDRDDDDEGIEIDPDATVAHKPQAPGRRRKKSKKADQPATPPAVGERPGDEAFDSAVEVDPVEHVEPNAEVDATRVLPGADQTEIFDADSPVETDLEAPPTTPLPARAEQLELSPNLIYTLPSDELLLKGAPHKER